MIASLRHFLGWMVSAFSSRQVSLAKTLLGFEIKNLRRVAALRRILLSFANYALRAWGKAQAARYLGELEVCC
jgi:hypothetical protein